MYADPSRELFAYNLACALARTRDPRAAIALGHAIVKGGDKVKARAAKDDDFADVRTESWFRALVPLT